MARNGTVPHCGTSFITVRFATTNATQIRSHRDDRAHRSARRSPAARPCPHSRIPTLQLLSRARLARIISYSTV